MTNVHPHNGQYEIQNKINWEASWMLNNQPGLDKNNTFGPADSLAVSNETPSVPASLVETKPMCILQTDKTTALN